jgi:hypothetical protein
MNQKQAKALAARINRSIHTRFWQTKWLGDHTATVQERSIDEGCWVQMANGIGEWDGGPLESWLDYVTWRESYQENIGDY